MISKGKSIHDKSYGIMISMIREIRESQNIKQSELAERIGVDQTVISKIENRERRLDLIELIMICKALNHSVVDFITQFEIQTSNDVPKLRDTSRK